MLPIIAFLYHRRRADKYAGIAGKLAFTFQLNPVHVCAVTLGANGMRRGIQGAALLTP